ncbi:MAG: SAM-dependent methyltransferase [Synechococcus sp. YX04-3]|nr:MAG: SAM-dependent methyltransferase [Synechococcus sp. YX04-3]
MTLACPACNTPFNDNGTLIKDLRCSNKTCTYYNIPYPIINNKPVLICPNLEYSILDTLDQFSNANNTITGFTGRDVDKKRLLFRQKVQDIFYDFSRVEFKNYKKLFQMLNRNSRVLIVGGGNIDTSYSSNLEWVQLFREKNINFTVTDIYLSKNVHFVCDAHYMPFLDSSFDAVIITTVLEHVLSPTIVVGEIYRVLNENGLLYATIPFIQCVHEGAYDFTRFTICGQRWLFRYFEEHESGVFVGTSCAYLYNFTTFISLVSNFKPLGILIRLFLWRLCALFDKLMPKTIHINQGMCNYFIGMKSINQSIKAGEMPDYYKKFIA